MNGKPADPEKEFQWDEKRDRDEIRVQWEWMEEPWGVYLGFVEQRTKSTKVIGRAFQALTIN